MQDNDQYTYGYVKRNDNGELRFFNVTIGDAPQEQRLTRAPRTAGNAARKQEEIPLEQYDGKALKITGEWQQEWMCSVDVLEAKPANGARLKASIKEFFG